ncbi:hypothetical protein cyc_08430 [Cyclospora cayetanensis]|uniref:Uncharacterized protein n=1 Tax=Cyclospora cayetanensis TaxID=88456 RepID=A0A1D3DA58_9EIME|nr:hypothetical protein cyc_08430 [Cyclospora cayetanensis]
MRVSPSIPPRRLSSQLAQKDCHRKGIGEFADSQEIGLFQALHKALLGRLLQGQSSFKGIAPLYIAALDASAALDGLLLLRRLSGASPAAASTAAAAETSAPTATECSMAVASKRLLRLYPADRLELVRHIPSWLQLLPPAARAPQPYDILLELVHSVLRSVDRGCSEEEGSGESDGVGEATGEGEAAANSKAASPPANSKPLEIRAEGALRASVAALLRLIETDLCLRLGVESATKAAEARDAMESSESSDSAAALVQHRVWTCLPSSVGTNGASVFIAWKGNSDSASSGSRHQGVEELLQLFVRYPVLSVQLKIDLLQDLAGLLELLTNLSICLSAVAGTESWWAVFSSLSEHLMQCKYPRLKLAAATTVAELVKHYMHVGSMRGQQQWRGPEEVEGGAKVSRGTNMFPEGGDTQLHQNFCFSGEFLQSDVAATEGGAAAQPLPEGATCQGTWAVLSLCIAPQAEKGLQHQDEGCLTESAGRIQEMQRSLRLRLSEAQDRADACRKAATGGL